MTIQQNPKHILAKKNNMEEIKCSHNDSNMLYMFWYQQKDTSMALIVFSYGATGDDPNSEDEFKDRFKLERKETLNGVLKISDLSLSDSAVYYCAVSLHSAVVFITCLTKNQTTRQTGNTHKNHSDISKIQLY